jgi:hypothetical protein
MLAILEEQIKYYETLPAGYLQNDDIKLMMLQIKQNDEVWYKWGYEEEEINSFLKQTNIENDSEFIY